jgi:tRNA pseudouridine32 synthase / 23S rRNA pseudouridine746 synthase
MDSEVSALPPTSRAPRPSFATLPTLRTPPATLLDYLGARFPQVGKATWARRFARGLVTDDDGAVLEAGAPYRPGLRLCYFREVEAESRIPFDEDIVFRNDHLLVADKPHFLPVVPSGPYVNECLLYRLQRSTGLEHLTPLHRLDLPAAGLVLFSTDPESRGAYHRLFDEHRLHREYRAVAAAARPPEWQERRIESRIVRGEPWFRMRTASGTPNALTRVVLDEWRDGRAFLRLIPESGKKHQLRLHLAEIGLPIEGDRLYPELQPPAPPDFERPLRLLAQRLRFRDPSSGDELDRKSRRDWP